VPQSRIVIGAGAVRAQNEQVLLVLVAHPFDDVRVRAESCCQLGHRAQRLLGRDCFGELAFLLDVRVAGQPGPAHDPRQQEPLHHQGHHDDPGGHEDDHVAAGEGAPGSNSLRYCQGRGERDRAPEAGHTAYHPCPVADAAQALLRPPIQKADQVRR
jgi:hypothetical protein